MTKSSNDMIELASIIESSDDAKEHWGSLCGVIAKLVITNIALIIKSLKLNL